MPALRNDHRLQRPLVIRLRLGVVAACFTIAPVISFAQSISQTAPAPTVAKLPVFDVVSIKLNKSHSGDIDTNSRSGRYSGSNVPIRVLMEQAYGVKKAHIYGIPGPLDSARFDIEAKVSEPDLAAIRSLSPEQRRAMFLPILTEYFHVKAHTETRVLPVFDLVVVKGGPKFHETPKESKERQRTGVHNTELEAHGVTMVSFASTLTDRRGVDRTVVDKTGLKGDFDLTLKWSRDDGDKQDDGTVDAAPPIFTALQEQLGLKLVSAKGPVETLVVDHVELPPEN